MFLVLALLGLVYAQSQECIFYTPTGRSIRPATAAGTCTPTDSSANAQNECCQSHNQGGPSCSFQQRAQVGLPEWFEDTSSKTATSTVCFVSEGAVSCHYLLKDNNNVTPFWSNFFIVTGGLGYEWKAGCKVLKASEDLAAEWYPQCDPQKYGNNPNPPKITQVPRNAFFRGPDEKTVYRKNVYCYQE